MPCAFFCLLWSASSFLGKFGLFGTQQFKFSLNNLSSQSSKTMSQPFLSLHEQFHNQVWKKKSFAIKRQVQNQSDPNVLCLIVSFGGICYQNLDLTCWAGLVTIHQLIKYKNQSLKILQINLHQQWVNTGSDPATLGGISDLPIPSSHFSLNV